MTFTVPKLLLNERDFVRLLLIRMRRERPDLRVRATNEATLEVEAVTGEPHHISVLNLYQHYCESPVDRDAMIGDFLVRRIYNEIPAVRGSFAENRSKIMPQVLPPTLADHSRRLNRALSSVSHVCGLPVAFVVDEVTGYNYLHQPDLERWGVTEELLFQTALENLRRLSRQAGRFHMIGRDERLMLLWETWDGYDASRILLQPELNEMAALVAGNPMIAIPHRDYMVMFGDASPAFVTEMSERVQEDFEDASYPITPRLFTLVDGTLKLHTGSHRTRLLN